MIGHGTGLRRVRFVLMPPVDLHESLAGDASRLRRYRQFVLGFALEALDQAELTLLLQRAAESLAAGIGIERTKVMRLRAEEGDLLVVAGIGWKPGVVG